MGRKPKAKTEKFDENKMETAYDFGKIKVKGDQLIVLFKYC